jgi:hypothetical protein
LVGAKVLDIFSMAGWYNKLVQYERDSAHKSRAEGGIASFDDCMHREQHHLQGEVGDLHCGLREVSSYGSCEPNSKEILCACANFSDCAKSLLAPSFAGAQVFVKA